MGLSRQEYWSGLPFPSPGDLPDPGIEPGSPALQADALTSEPPGKPVNKYYLKKTKSKRFLGGPVVKTLPSNIRVVGLNPSQEAKIPHISQWKNQDVKQKQLLWQIQ